MVKKTAARYGALIEAARKRCAGLGYDKPLRDATTAMRGEAVVVREA
jgi:hypothetical protein